MLNAPAAVCRSIVPFPPTVEAAETIRPLDSETTMFPLVELVALSVPTLVLILAVPVAPIPLAAVSVAVPEVAMFAASPEDVASVIAPNESPNVPPIPAKLADTVMSPLVLETADRSMDPSPLRVIVPLTVEMEEPSTMLTTPEDASGAL